MATHGPTWLRGPTKSTKLDPKIWNIYPKSELLTIYYLPTVCSLLSFLLLPGLLLAIALSIDCFLSLTNVDICPFLLSPSHTVLVHGPKYSKLLSLMVSCGPQIMEFNLKIRNNLGQDTVSILSLLEI